MIDVLEHVEPNKDCDKCDHINDYVCFDCEWEQVKEKYPNAKWDPPDWTLPNTVEELKKEITKLKKENKELKEDNKKLAKEVYDKANLVGRLRDKGLI